MLCTSSEYVVFWSTFARELRDSILDIKVRRQFAGVSEVQATSDHGSVIDRICQCLQL